MKTLICIFVFVLAGQFLSGQESSGNILSEKIKFIPVEKTILYRLANKEIPIKVQQYGSRDDIVFINLHDDESTSVDAAKKIMEYTGGVLIEIENNQKRNIRFVIDRYTYSIDPNRIFSKKGITRSLSEKGRISAKAIEEAEKLGRQIVGLIPEKAICIIALHNNTPDLFSAQTYLPGNNRDNEVSKIYLTPTQDPDDFFLTTARDLYEKLSDKGYNTILQDNMNCTDDGSLSVYCGKKNKRYVNCETEHGKSEQYEEMIKTLMSFLILNP